MSSQFSSFSFKKEFTDKNIWDIHYYVITHLLRDIWNWKILPPKKLLKTK